MVRCKWDSSTIPDDDHTVQLWTQTTVRALRETVYDAEFNAREGQATLQQVCGEPLVHIADCRPVLNGLRI